jgi:hypothetical protein
MDCFASLAMTGREQPSLPEELAQQPRRLALAQRAGDLRHVVAGRLGEEPYA